MPRLTRNSSRSTNGERSDEEQENASLSVSKKGPPSSEMAYERKFIVAKEGTLTNSCLYKIRHPKSGAAVLLRLSEENCDEDKFLELDEILTDEEQPAIGLLEKNKQLLKTIEKVADVKNVCDSRVYRYNSQLAMQWIQTRFERIKLYLQEEAALHKAILDSSDVLNRYTFGVLSDYLSAEMTASAKQFLDITDIKCEETVDMNMYGKRKTDEDELSKEQPAKARQSILFTIHHKSC
ncbi:hypothetical protein WR25_22092 [Diploscapter pachys]|uniref:Ribonuclease H2 subunit B wHTH domain-containing protein n=1 Tax=Diploscapter pachys TaxID=2018661 RepID=A0A2A2LVX3_9BILA|nr:hypothetical protein WR25_22092 [Diploscapter pachys]